MTRGERIAWYGFLAFFALIFVVGVPAALLPLRHCVQAWVADTPAAADYHRHACDMALRGDIKGFD